MLHTVKKLLHKALGLYIIAGFTTVGILKTFAQDKGQDLGGFGIQEGKTDGLSGIQGSGNSDDTLLDIIRNGMNWALGLVSLIAFGMLLFGGYKMVASGGDEGAYKEGIKILKNAAIGIAFISISWVLVTFIFAAVGLISGGGSATAG